MRKLSIEVKTVYHIRFDFHDFVKIYEQARKDPVLLNAFSDFDLNDTTIGNLRKCFKSLGKHSILQTAEEAKQKCENLKYIISKLGFDSIEWYGGFYDKEEREYCITVSNRGADI